MPSSGGGGSALGGIVRSCVCEPAPVPPFAPAWPASNLATRSANRTVSPAVSTREPVSRSLLTKVPLVEFRSRIVTVPAGSVVTSAWRRLTNRSSRTRSAVSEWPITICGAESTSTLPAWSACPVTTSRGARASLAAMVDSPFAAAGRHRQSQRGPRGRIAARDRGRPPSVVHSVRHLLLSTRWLAAGGGEPLPAGTAERLPHPGMSLSWYALYISSMTFSRACPHPP